MGRPPRSARHPARSVVTLLLYNTTPSIHVYYAREPRRATLQLQLPITAAAAYYLTSTVRGAHAQACITALTPFIPVGSLLEEHGDSLVRNRSEGCGRVEATMCDDRWPFPTEKPELD